MPDDAISHAAEAVLSHFRSRRLRLATAESCTGGLVAAAVTALAGSSDVFERGFVTYSNEAKRELLQVPAMLIQSVGAVSEEVAASMAQGALRQSHADVAVSVTGIAGPGGATPDKPVGLVWFGAAVRGGEARAERALFAGDRTAVRAQAVLHALRLALRIAGAETPGG